MSPVIKLEQDQQDEERELEIELDYQSTLTTAQRFEMMFRKSREIVIELLKRGYREPVKVIKRA